MTSKMATEDYETAEDYEAACDYLYGTHTYRLSPLDRLRQYLYSDADEFDKHDVPILYINEQMEKHVKEFEEKFKIRLPDEVYEIFVLTGIQKRVRQFLNHDLTLPTNANDAVAHFQIH